MYVPTIYQNTGRGQSKRACAADNQSGEAMASQVEETFCLDSVVRGHHVYKTIWTPFLGEILTAIAEPGNSHDRHAVCVKKEGHGEIVGHVPRELSRTVWHFLMHGGQLTGEVNGRRKLGNGLEVPCVYKFTGSRKLVKRMEQLLSI